MARFDYQSNRHCAKTKVLWTEHNYCLITSQIDTAPKLPCAFGYSNPGLITSQIDTAPKLKVLYSEVPKSLITSQIDTAPKL